MLNKFLKHIFFAEAKEKVNKVAQNIFNVLQDAFHPNIKIKNPVKKEDIVMRVSDRSPAQLKEFSNKDQGIIYRGGVYSIKNNEITAQALKNCILYNRKPIFAYNLSAEQKNEISQQETIPLVGVSTTNNLDAALDFAEAEYGKKHFGTGVKSDNDGKYLNFIFCTELDRAIDVYKTVLGSNHPVCNTFKDDPHDSETVELIKLLKQCEILVTTPIHIDMLLVTVQEQDFAKFKQGQSVHNYVHDIQPGVPATVNKYATKSMGHLLLWMYLSGPMEDLRQFLDSRNININVVLKEIYNNPQADADIKKMQDLLPEFSHDKYIGKFSVADIKKAFKTFIDGYIEHSNNNVAVGPN